MCAGSILIILILVLFELKLAPWRWLLFWFWFFYDYQSNIVTFIDLLSWHFSNLRKMTHYYQHSGFHIFHNLQLRMKVNWWGWWWGQFQRQWISCKMRNAHTHTCSMEIFFFPDYLSACIVWLVMLNCMTFDWNGRLRTKNKAKKNAITVIIFVKHRKTLKLCARKRCVGLYCRKSVFSKTAKTAFILQQCIWTKCSKGKVAGWVQQFVCYFGK